MATFGANFLIISLTINICVLFTIALPAIIRFFLVRFLKGRYLLRYKVSIQENAAFFRRIYLDVIVNGTAITTGGILMVTSQVSTNPFFTSSEAISVVFSAFVGWQVFKIFQNICDPDKSAKHAKVSSVLRVVAIGLYISTLAYKQCAILGIVGLVVEGHVMFFKICKLWQIWKVDAKCRLYIVSLRITCISATLLRAVFPFTTLVVLIRYHWPQILLMDYVPLAVFFLCLVFFTAVNLWLVKVTFDPLIEMKSAKRKMRQGILLFTSNPAAPTFIHNDLWNGRGRSVSAANDFNSSSYVVRHSDTTSAECV